MPLTAGETDIEQIIKTTVPKWFFAIVSADKTMWDAFIKLFDAARTFIDDTIALTLIKQAVDMWLDQHARDRGTYRQADESDVALRNRLRKFADAVTPPAIVDAAEQALNDDGVTIPTNYPGLVETRKDRAYMQENAIGRKRAYLSRGYRMCGERGSIVVILPYGTSAGTAATVYEAVRKKKAGGFVHRVERRQSP